MANSLWDELAQKVAATVVLINIIESLLCGVTPLVCLWQNRARINEASDLVAALGWFTEGFGMADLKEPKALLEAMS